MVIVQELVVFKTQIKTCKDLLLLFVNSIDHKLKSYRIGYIVFDNYSVETSLKDAISKRRTDGKSVHKGYKVKDSTKIKDFEIFLSSTVTKNNPTLYLAQNAIKYSKSLIVKMTHEQVLKSPQDNTINEIDIVETLSTHEEADTKIIFIASEVHKSGMNVHIYSQDTDVLVLIVSVLPHLGEDTVLILGHGENRRNLKLQYVYDQLGEIRARALPAMHALSGCDTTGHTQSKSKQSWFNTFFKLPEDSYNSQLLVLVIYQQSKC